MAQISFVYQDGWLFVRSRTAITVEREGRHFDVLHFAASNTDADFRAFIRTWTRIHPTENEHDGITEETQSCA